MRAIHNTPALEEIDFPIPADCVCDDGTQLCAPCAQVLAEALAQQAKDEQALLASE